MKIEKNISQQETETTPNLKADTVPEIELPDQVKKEQEKIEPSEQINNVKNFSELYEVLEHLFEDAGGVIVSERSKLQFTFESLKARIEAFRNEDFEPDMEDRFALIPGIFKGSVRRKAVELMGQGFFDKRKLHRRIFHSDPADYTKVKRHRNFTERAQLDKEFRE